MQRRSFLQGVFGGITSAGLLVTATPKEIEAFTAPIVHGAPLVLDQSKPDTSSVDVGEHLYNKRGELVAIVRHMQAERDSVEVTSVFDSNRVFVPGLMHITLTADVLGSMELTSNKMPTLRGSRSA